jgi:glycosyltransferase involved in cell wall biosynthesis
MYDLYHRQDGWVHRTATQLQRWVFNQDARTGVDLWVANSDVVARRMHRYWELDRDDIRVVYPPIKTQEFSPDLQETGDYYVTLGRLDPLKHTEEAIRAANTLGLKLKVAGTGPEEERLRELAGPTVEMLGWVDGERKGELLAGARAMISCSAQEDFGMAVIEAMASGTPVLTVDEGMPAHSVADGIRGAHFQRGELASAIMQFEADGVTCSEKQLAGWAGQYFGVDRFLQEMQSVIEEAQQRTRIEPVFETAEIPIEADD